MAKQNRKSTTAQAPAQVAAQAPAAVPAAIAKLVAALPAPSATASTAYPAATVVKWVAPSNPKRAGTGAWVRAQLIMGTCQANNGSATYAQLAQAWAAAKATGNKAFAGGYTLGAEVNYCAKAHGAKGGNKAPYLVLTLPK